MPSNTRRVSVCVCVCVASPRRGRPRALRVLCTSHQGAGWLWLTVLAGSVDDAYIADVVRRPNSQVVVHSRNGTPVGLACFHIELRALHGTFDTILIAVDLLLGSQGASASALLLAFAGWWAAEFKLALRSGINPFPRHASASARAVQIWGKLHAVGSALHLYEEQGWEQQGTSKDGLIRMFKPLTIVNVPEPDDLRASGGAHVNVPCKVVHVWRAPMPLWRRK